LISSFIATTCPQQQQQQQQQEQQQQQQQGGEEKLWSADIRKNVTKAAVEKEHAALRSSHEYCSVNFTVLTTVTFGATKYIFTPLNMLSTYASECMQS
jgi:hypothetical protein